MQTKTVWEVHEYIGLHINKVLEEGFIEDEQYVAIHTFVDTALAEWVNLSGGSDIMTLDAGLYLDQATTDLVVRAVRQGGPANELAFTQWLAMPSGGLDDLPYQTLADFKLPDGFNPAFEYGESVYTSNLADVITNAVRTNYPEAANDDVSAALPKSPQQILRDSGEYKGCGKSKPDTTATDGTTTGG